MTAPSDRPAPTAAHSTSPARAPELAAEVREGLTRLEPEALQTFFEHYFDRVHGYLRRLVREEHLAEDLTQDVFLHVHRSLPRYDPERPLSPWVYTIATNKVRDHWRSRRHQEERRVQSVDDEEGGIELSARDGAPAAELESDETGRQVADAVGTLPDMLRETFVLRFYEGLSFEEIGRLVDRNETAVRKRYSRALQELRGTLAHLVDE